MTHFMYLHTVLSMAIGSAWARDPQSYWLGPVNRHVFKAAMRFGNSELAAQEDVS